MIDDDFIRMVGFLRAGGVKCNSGSPVKNDCYGCKNKRSIPGNCHIACANPDAEMTGHHHGVKSGWFLYPICFDPIWMTKNCNNFIPLSSTAE